MPPRVIFHIGPPKTATTYLQRQLQHNVATLAERGITVAGPQRALRAAASDLLGRGPRPGTHPRPGSWDRLRDQVAEAPGDVVVSCERFSLLTAQQAQKVCEDLGGLGGREFHLVLTYRDGTHLASRWQERIKNGATEDFPAFCDRIVTSTAFRTRMLRMAQPLEAWSHLVAPERLHVVTVPAPGSPRRVVLDRFCEVFDVPHGTLEESTAKAHNPSLGLAEVEVLRLLNDRLAGVVPDPVRHDLAHLFLAEQVLSRRSGSPGRLIPTAAAYEAARSDTQAVIDQVIAAGHPVHGDLADLLAQGPPGTGAATVEPQEVLDAALDALTAMTVRVEETRSQQKAQRRPRPASPTPSKPERRWRLPGLR